MMVGRVISASTMPPARGAERGTPKTPIEAASQLEIIKAEVNGLVCDFCAQALNKVFKKTEQVESVDVDLDNGFVTVTLIEGGVLSDDEVKKLIRKSGYSFVGLERTDGA